MPMISKNQISGMMCAWRGCTATLKGQTPPGWMNLLTYCAPKAETPPRFSPRPDALGRRLVPGAQPGPRSVAENPCPLSVPRAPLKLGERLIGCVRR
jgi:hypothetical protein